MQFDAHFEQQFLVQWSISCKYIHLKHFCLNCYRFLDTII